MSSTAPDMDTCTTYIPHANNSPYGLPNTYGPYDIEIMTDHCNF
jgi:hypothetical protein